MLDHAIIENEAMRLPDHQRALLAERLFSSLVAQNSDREKLWITESQDRLKAYENGEIEALDGEGVLEELNSFLVTIVR